MFICQKSKKFFLRNIKNASKKSGGKKRFSKKPIGDYKLYKFPRYYVSVKQ